MKETMLFYDNKKVNKGVTLVSLVKRFTNNSMVDTTTCKFFMKLPSFVRVKIYS